MPGRARNTDEMLYPSAAAAQVGQDATYWGAWSAAVGGTWYGGRPLGNNPPPLSLGARYRIAALALVMTVANGDMRAALAEKGIRGVVSGTLYISVHTADPGVTGANEIGVGRVAIDAAEWTIDQT